MGRDYGTHFDLLRAITRELPHHYPFVITQQYIGDFVAQWKKPYETLFREIQRVLIKHIKKFVSDQFSQYPNLMHRVQYVYLKNH